MLLSLLMISPPLPQSHISWFFYLFAKAVSQHFQQPREKDPRKGLFTAKSTETKLKRRIWKLFGSTPPPLLSVRGRGPSRLALNGKGQTRKLLGHIHILLPPPQRTYTQVVENERHSTWWSLLSSNSFKRVCFSPPRAPQRRHVISPEKARFRFGRAW